MSLEQYNEVCKDEFKAIRNSIDSLNDRLFKDNGHKSIQTILTEVKLWQGNHDAENSNKVCFWYWLIPLLLSLGILIIDKFLK